MLGNECFAIQYYRMKNMFIMLLAMLCVVSAYAQDFEVDGLSYQVTKSPDGESPGEVEVTGGEIKEEIEFPETVTYNSATYMVTSIGSNAFSGRRNSGNFTKKYIIPGTVRSIGNSAFYDNYYLEEVEFNEGLQTIGVAAFGYNFALKEIRIPSTVTAIENGAFRTNQQNQATISCLAATPPANLGSETFQGRTDATLHVVAADVEAYQEAEYWKDFSVISGDILINRCSLPVITCDNNILTISCKTEGAAIYYTTDGSVPDENALRYTSPISYTTNQIIRAIAIAEGYESSSVKNFYDKEQVEIVTDAQGIKYTLKQADDGSFYYSVTWHSYEMNAETVIPAALGGCPVKTIEASAFRSCSDLTSVTLPNSITSIGENAFYGCSALTSITLSSQLTAIGRETFQGCTSLSSITIPDGVTTIGEQAFKDCSSLSSITIPNSVTSIGERAFWGCNGLTSITLPSSVTTMGGAAFSGCTSLTSIKLPESLTSLGESVFYGCPLKSIELPNSFTVIPENLFSNNDFQYIKLGNNVKSIGKSAFGSYEPVLEIGTSTPPSIASDAFPNVEYLSDLTVIVPNAKAETAYRKKAVWEEMTFSNQNNISEVTVDTPGDLSFELITECNMMPAKVVGLKVNGTINADDFTQMLVNMKSLLRLDLSDCDITEIPDEALSGKTQLKELTLPTNLQAIGANAFHDCPYLTGELVIPSTVTSIGDYAFEGTDYSSVKLPNALKTIGNYAFNNLPLEQRLVLPGKVTSVGTGAFAGTKITGLSIPDGVKSIGAHAFADTPIQGHLTIPDGVTDLGEGAFMNTQISLYK